LTFEVDSLSFPRFGGMISQTRDSFFAFLTDWLLDRGWESAYLGFSVPTLHVTATDVFLSIFVSILCFDSLFHMAVNIFWNFMGQLPALYYWLYG
jgi:hypothetical protein